MVRVISEKLFSPPRSRHSSGETVDKELAARAVEALSSLNSRRLEFSDYESSSDSYWDSELDFDGECHENPAGEGEARAPGTDVVRKRKERRRERNKLSAQAYRIRRREQSVGQQKLLSSLQEENTRLKRMVDSLETELDKVRHAVRHRLPATAIATTTTPLPTPTPSTSSTPTPLEDQAPLASLSLPTEGLLTFSQLAKKEAATTSDHHHHHLHQNHQQQNVVDNDNSRRQQISPVVDNFSFSRPAPSTPTLLTPSTSPVPMAMTSAPNPTKVGQGQGQGLSLTSKTFTFPPSPLHHHPASCFTKTTTPLPTISEKPVIHVGKFIHHPHQQPTQQPDFNANANTRITTTTSNVNNNNNNSVAFGGGVCQNDNMNNNNNCNLNNNNVFMAVGGSTQGATGAGLVLAKPAFHFSKA